MERTGRFLSNCFPARKTMSARKQNAGTALKEHEINIKISHHICNVVIPGDLDRTFPRQSSPWEAVAQARLPVLKEGCQACASPIRAPHFAPGWSRGASVPHLFAAIYILFGNAAGTHLKAFA
jgi:hypothetical protein